MRLINELDAAIESKKREEIPLSRFNGVSEGSGWLGRQINAPLAIESMVDVCVFFLLRVSDVRWAVQSEEIVDEPKQLPLPSEPNR